MWTRVVVDSYVPPGYSDSGWQKDVVYVCHVVDIATARKAIAKWYWNTEVTSWNVISIEICDEICRDGWNALLNVCDVDGKWVEP